MSGEEIRFNFGKYDIAKCLGNLTGDKVLKTEADVWSIFDKNINFPPVKMPEAPFAKEIHDWGFDRTKEFEEQNRKNGINPVSIDWYAPEQNDNMDSLKKQISKIDVKKIMEDFQDNYGK